MRKIKKWFSGFTALCVCLFGFSSCSLSLDDVMSDFGLGGLTSSSSVDERGDAQSSSDTGDTSTGEESAGSDGSGESGSTNGETAGGGNEEGGEEDIVTDEVSVHFLEVGNKNTGDCTLIKVGNTEVLIDAGSRKNSAPTLISYINQYCTDGVLEYVIATHAHQDHISGFIGNKVSGERNGIFYGYEIDTLIQFSQTEQSPTTESGGVSLYGEYLEAVAYAKSQGTVVYDALDCYNNANGAKRSYSLGENVTMNVLYQEFYEKDAGTENDYSVCMLLTQGENNYLFTGDLEEDGEESLVEHNELPKCKLFKAGHHGSYTANSTALLSVIQPDIVCVCCCAGWKEYSNVVANQFPSQAFIDNVAPYTNRVYVTTIVSTNTDGFQSMNGNIVVTGNEDGVTVRCSNNDIVLKDTEWFKENRVCPDAWKEGA